ncbi:hypothetical protein JTE90_023251 [Oedothorax gibbosus]|uniref:Synaptotagmin-like protein 5 n=1 Tax=Oedothorax gibbosus TaxID=931172 RepID=A0AAV6U372_9ARAC|nr:hypothetical protein JTE90_023251 [Oedothorax gibbosus]
MADWSYLSPAEYEKISSVLKRDRELRSLEEIRIKQLKQELVCLRKRAALRPGLDSQRSCARCLTELGRIINRGALCPSCKKKVCKECRNYDENHEWICIFCHKQMQLKAVSGEWMQDFSKHSVRRYAKDPPGDQLRKVLHESQRKGLFDPDAEQRNASYASAVSPVKFPSSVRCEQQPVCEDAVEAPAAKKSSTEAIASIETEKKDVSSFTPKVLPRVSPWNGIDPEPTIPRRIDHSRPLGTAYQYESCSENHAHRERQSSDEGHCTIGCRSRSTSSEVIDESETLTPVPLPRKRLSPLKKQQAVPEPSAVENQQSSVDTVDSGVFSPGLKLESSIDTTAPSSPLAVSRLSSVEQEPMQKPYRPPLLAQSLTKESSSSEEDTDTKPADIVTPKSSENMFRKVTLKKKRYSSGPKGLKDKRSATLSAEIRPIAPPSGLKCSFSNNNKSNISSNSDNISNSQRKLTSAQTNIPSCPNTKFPIISSSLIPKLKNNEVLKHSNSQKHAKISLGSALPISEALCDGRKKTSKADRNHMKNPPPSPEEDKLLKTGKKCRIPRGQVSRRSRERKKEKRNLSEKNNEIEAHPQKVNQTNNSSNRNCIPKSKVSKKINKLKVEHSANLSGNEIPNSLVPNKEVNEYKELNTTKPQCFNENPSRLFRSASLPYRKTFVYDWLQSWWWRCYSLEDWLWCMDEQCNEIPNFNHLNILPDDYKLVYVSSSSNSSDSDESSPSKSSHIPTSRIICPKLNYNTSYLSLFSHAKTNCDTVIIKCSDCESELNRSDEFDLSLATSESKALIQVNEVNSLFVDRNLHTDVKWDHEQKQHCSSKVKKSKYASTSILNPSSVCLAKCSEKQFKFPFSTTHEERCVVQSHVISPETLPTGRCGSYFLLPQYEFRNLTWRCEKAGNPLYPGDVASPPRLTNRSRNRKTLVTGWGQERCCVARVIDLAGALCGLDLTRCLAITGVSSSAKHGGRTVNAFFYRAPPVAGLKPEVDYLLRLTRSDPRLLFQLGFVFETSGGVARMLAIKSEEDYVDKVCLQGTGVGAMQIEETESSVRELAPPDVSRSSGGGSKKSVQATSDDKKWTLETCGDDGYAFISYLNSDDVGDFNNFNSKISKNNRDCNSDVSKIAFYNDQAQNYLCNFDSEVLSCVKYMFCQDFSCESNASCKNSALNIDSLICDNTERVDCQCNKPCDVPLSPSVVDATGDARNFIEDGEIFSSGDELDKIESDTDSQDTVIEGEAYKRIRSVAIKEKILHANEELFGVDYKENCYNRESHKLSNAETTERNSNSRFDIEEITRKALQSIFLEDHHNEIPKFLCSSLQETKIHETHLPNEYQFKPFQKTEKSAFHPVSPSSFSEKKNDHLFTDCRNLLSESSSYKKSYSENVCSSESSDNGSDGEEVILSDTSTSSDEATYIAPSAGFRYYNQHLPFRLHTIVEESCEESEKSSRGATPTSRANSEFEYYDKTRISSSKHKKKIIRKPNNDSAALGHSKNIKSSTSYAVLATSRLEKYFKSGLLEGEVPYPEGDLTDESGGISSDDDIASVHLNLNDKFKNHILSTKPVVERQNKKTPTHEKSVVKSVSPDTNTHKKYSYSDAVKKSERKRNSPNSTSLRKLEPSTSNLKHLKDNEPYDEDAKYIMSHLMQHINNDTEDKSECTTDSKDVSPMLKILESEIARLMLTVSPASLSAGEPSSSCSSTIGSNNSDYGSDTLESAEETTSDEEINAEIVSESRALVEIAPQNESVSTLDINEASSTGVEETSSASQIVDSTVSEETLYICKQLMASLKNIADTTDITVASDELSSNTEDHSAKQYITDQIISLMQTVSASHNSPLLRTLTLNPSNSFGLDSDVSQERSDSDSPSPNGEKRDLPKSKTPSESGSETTISASISIPSYDDSDRTPTESEISHEMDELYALLENNGTPQDIISAKFSYDLETISQEKVDYLQHIDSPVSEGESSSDSCDMNSTLSESHSSLLSGAASKLESLLPITIEERIARYKKAFMTKTDEKESETRINVILPQPSKSDSKHSDDISMYRDSELPCFSATLKAGESCDIMPYNSNASNNDGGYNITSVKIVSHNTYPLSSAIHKILSSNIDSKYLEQKLDYQIVNILDDSTENTLCDNNLKEEFVFEENELCEDSESNTIVPLPKVMNPKEKASSENDLLVANYRAKSKGNKVLATKSVGNISELENTNSKSAFRDTGYYSFKSSEESFLSLDDSTASQTSTTSLTQYRSLTSTETIPEEEESGAKGPSSAKMSLSSSNIPDAVCDTSASKSSTLPLSLRNKLSGTPGGNHRSRSSFFSTSGVLRKLSQLRDESGNSLRSSPHGRLRMRNRSLSGGSEDGKQRKSSVPQISVSEFSEIGHSSGATSEKDSSGIQEDEIDQAFAYHCRSQMSLSTFGGRSESVTSVYSAAGGGRYGTVTVTGEICFGLIYNHKAGILEIVIKECRNLAAVDTKRNRSDPYVKAYLLPDRTKSGKRKTKVKKHTLNPSFDESLKFHVAMNELVIRTLWLSVWHSDRFGRNDFLGEVMLPLDNDAVENSCTKWYPLQERLETLDAHVSYKGDLILALKYVPPDVTSRKFSKKPGIPVKGSLEVLVREARNLMATRSNGTSDPFCKSYLLPDKSKSGKQKTPVFKKSCNPKWNHTFVYDDVSLDDLKERCLELTIWDYDKITSNDFLGGVRLCLGTGKYQGREVDWMDSMGEERSLWYTMLERPNTWVDGSLLLRPNMQSRRML